MKVGHSSNIKIIYFSDEKGTTQRLVYEGSAKQLKEEQFGNDWDGFDLGDSFHIEGEEVRVYSKHTHIDEGKVVYIVGPYGLNPNKIDYKKFKA